MNGMSAGCGAAIGTLGGAAARAVVLPGHDLRGLSCPRHDAVASPASIRSASEEVPAGQLMPVGGSATRTGRVG